MPQPKPEVYRFVTTALSSANSPPISKPKGKLRLWLLCLSLVFVFVSIGFYLIDAYWPYRYRNVDPLLQKVFASQIKIDHYHRTYFPSPGFVAAS
jgi:hypothetical protein